MTEHGPLDRLLHRLALGADAVGETAVALDAALAPPAPAETGPHVFVSGLARAGTTILMRRIHATGAFRSLTYADMPFVLAPNFWRRLRRGGAAGPAAERAHGDGIAVNTESPEALDEVFWRVFDGAGYIGPDRLRPHDPPAEVVGRYRAYVGRILASTGHRRYLSKTNNGVLRLGALARAFPDATILIPFRAPLDHAASLLAQHRRFAALHARDGFARDYMRWLVHHEFGADHRPFATHPASAHAPETAAYWLDQWVGAYRWALDTAPAGAVFVCYEDLCADPGVWRAIAERIGVAPDAGADAPGFRRRARADVADAAPPARVAEAEALYATLRARAIGSRAAAAAA